MVYSRVPRRKLGNRSADAGCFVLHSRIWDVSVGAVGQGRGDEFASVTARQITTTTTALAYIDNIPSHVAIPSQALDQGGSGTLDHATRRNAFDEDDLTNYTLCCATGFRVVDLRYLS
jgi:hypothetical protein